MSSSSAFHTYQGDAENAISWMQSEYEDVVAERDEAERRVEELASENAALAVGS